jgi:serine/threonine-protein kinase
MSDRPSIIVPGSTQTADTAWYDPRQLLTQGYQLIDRLGAGGMGEVWRARSLRLDRFVAIKRVISNTPGSNDLLVHEAKAIAGLRHPAIVQVYDVIYDRSGSPYLVMELLDGADLGHIVDEQGPLDERRAVKLMVGIVSGLEAAHRGGVVHGDVKPDNILLTKDSTGAESGVLLDFGISQALGPNSEQPSFVAGTPEFMAPEQVEGAVAGIHADQWSTCVTLYTIVTGHQPFIRETVPELFDAIRTASLPYPRAPSMNPSLFSILARGTRKQPGERYRDMRELGQALEIWLRSNPRRPTHDSWR